MKRLLFVFLDGVGLGPAGPANPLSQHSGPGFRRLAQGQNWVASLSPQAGPLHCVTSLDATLGMSGLPQSGTGQASLLTGQNCADMVGRHFGPFPHSATHAILDEASLFHQVQTPRSPSPAFANAFPPQYFQREEQRRETVTTRACRAAGLPLRDLEALRTDRALTAGLTGQTWQNRLGLSVPTRSARAAARVLASLARAHSLTFFEYFRTDKIGHRRRDESPAALLSRLDAFFDALIAALDLDTEALLVTSDHGNLENMSHTQHTRNPVPLFVVGWAAPYFTEATSLTDVTPGIVDALPLGGTPHASGTSSSTTRSAS